MITCLIFAMIFVASVIFNEPVTAEIYTLSLHDALPISGKSARASWSMSPRVGITALPTPRGFVLEVRVSADIRSEEHTSELQSRRDLVCRLLLEKKKKKIHDTQTDFFQRPTHTPYHTFN